MSVSEHKLNRGFSKVDESQSLVCKARNELTQGIWDALGHSNHPSDEQCNMSISKHTFMLPDLSVYEGKAFLKMISGLFYYHKI